MPPNPLVLLANTPWGGAYRKASVELARALSGDRPVLYVDPAASVAPAQGVGHALRMPWEDRGQFVAEGRVLRLVPPEVLPHNGLPEGFLYRGVVALNRARYLGALRAALARLGWSRFDLVTAWHPVWAPPAGEPGVARHIYFAYDEIRAAAWNGRHGAAAEDALVPRVDAVVATSVPLATRLARPAGARPIEVIPNGVDVAAFPAPTTHPLLRGLPRPVAGLLGVLDERVDVALLAALGRRLPEVSLALVGPATAGFVAAAAREGLAGLPNVHLLGAVAPDEAPAVIAGFDVGLIPFVSSPFTAAIQPVKGWEYLAAGLPVVATGFARLAELDPWVAQADGVVAFAAAVSGALLAPSRADQRRHFAAQGSWGARADAWRSVLDQPVRMAA